MKKTLLICIMCLVAALCLCLSACNPEEHTHSFTSGEYQSTASGHKQKCTGCDEYGPEEAHTLGADGKCTVCGFEKQEGEEHKHDFTSGEFQTSEAGHKQKCKGCNEYEPTETPHTFDADGKCAVCGYKQHTHDFTSGKFQTSENGHKQKCKDCDEYEETEHPHTFDADGKKCTVCGYEKKDSEPTEPTHHLTKEEAKQPSCTEEGNIEYYTCSDSACKGKFFDEKGNELDEEKVFLEKVDHVYVEHDEKAATCTEKGMERHFTCKNCDTLFDSDKKETTKEKLEIETTEHSYTFKSNGVNDHAQVCSNCGSAQDNEAHELNDKGECKCGFKASNDLLTFEYNNDDMTAKVASVTPPEEGDFEVIVPRTVINEGETYTVTTIGNLGYDDFYITFIMPDTITTIEDSAFYYQQELTTFVISKNIVNVSGSYTFYGISAKKVSIFYSGTKEEWETTKPLLTKCYFPENAKVFFYSATDLGEDSIDTWHYVDDKPVLWHQDEFTYSTEEFEFTYSLKKGTATVVAYKGEGGLVAIPETITVEGEEYDVTAIGEDIFHGDTYVTNSVTGVVLPDSIESIAYHAFYNNAVTTLVIGPNITEHIDQIDTAAFYYMFSYSDPLKLYFKGDEEEYNKFYQAISEKGISDLTGAIKDKFVYLKVDKDKYEGVYGTWEFEADGKTPKILSEHEVVPVVLPDSIYGNYECEGYWGNKYTLVVTEENKMIVTESYYVSNYSIVGYSNGTLDIVDDDTAYETTATYDENAGTITIGFNTYTKVKEEEDINLPEGIQGEYKNNLGTITIDKDNLTVTFVDSYGLRYNFTIKGYDSGEVELEGEVTATLTYNEDSKTVKFILGTSSDYGEFTKVEESGDEIDVEAFKNIVNGTYVDNRGNKVTVDYPYITQEMGFMDPVKYTITAFRQDGTYDAQQDGTSTVVSGNWTKEGGLISLKSYTFTKQQAAEPDLPDEGGDDEMPSELQGTWKNGYNSLEIEGTTVVKKYNNVVEKGTYTIDSYKDGVITMTNNTNPQDVVTLTYDSSAGTLTEHTSTGDRVYTKA